MYVHPCRCLCGECVCTSLCAPGVWVGAGVSVTKWGFCVTWMIVAASSSSSSSANGPPEYGFWKHVPRWDFSFHSVSTRFDPESRAYQEVCAYCVPLPHPLPLRDTTAARIHSCVSVHMRGPTRKTSTHIHTVLLCSGGDFSVGLGPVTQPAWMN